MRYLIGAFYKYTCHISARDTTSLAYYIILTVVPMMTLMVLAFSYLRFDVQMVKSVLSSYFTNEFTLVLIDYFMSHSAGYFSVFVIVMSLIIASRGIYRLKMRTDEIYEIPNQTVNFVRTRLYAVVNTLTFILFASMMIMALGILPSIGILFQWTPFAFLENYVFDFLFIFVLMLSLNLMIPSVWPGFKAASGGSLVSSGGMMILIIFIRFFRNAATYDAIYGPLASIAAILVMLNWMCMIIYYGICFSAMIYLEKKKEEKRHEK